MNHLPRAASKGSTLASTTVTEAPPGAWSSPCLDDNLFELLQADPLSRKVPILDTQVLEGVSCEPSFLIELCQSFLQHAPARIESLTAAVEKENGTTLKEAAHALKSLSTCVGALHLFQLCKAMESLREKNLFPLASSLLKSIKIEYQQVQKAIQDYQNSLSATL